MSKLIRILGNYDKMSKEARLFSRAIKLPQEELAAVDSKLIVQTGGSL